MKKVILDCGTSAEGRNSNHFFIVLNSISISILLSSVILLEDISVRNKYMA
jgi:hypothetical protein